MSVPASSGRYRLGVAGLVVLAGAVLAASGLHPLALLAVAGLVALVWAARRVPFAFLAAGLLFLTLVLDNPGAHPYMGHWQSPLHWPGLFWFQNLPASLGLPLSVSGLELALAGVLAVLAVRLIKGEEPGFPPATRLLFVVGAVTLGTIAFLELWGVGRGGNFRQSLWQMRQLLWLPFMVVLFMAALRTDAARRLLVRVVVVAAVVRALLGIWFYLTIVRPQDLTVSYVTLHSDTVAFVLATVLVIVELLERRSFGTVLQAAVVLPLVGVALVLNDRRLAFVALPLALLVLVSLMRPASRRWVLFAGGLAAPLIALYVAAGWNSEALFFRPVTSVQSIFDDEDSSTRSRDIENYNLVQTVWRSPPIGRGFGYEYVEVTEGSDLSEIFEQYRYLPHNSVLWLLGVAGPVGFFLLWLFPTIGVFLGARTYRRARNPTQDLVALGVIAAVLVWGAQAYGDIGMHSWQATMTMAAFIGGVGRLAAQVGAWHATRKPFEARGAVAALEGGR